MIRRQSIFTFISSVACSLSLLAQPANAANDPSLAVGQDSVPLLKGMAVSVDIAGPLARAMSDYGEVEGAFRLNLRDKYYPIAEVGYGSAKHDDEVTGIYYKTQAPYFRLGCDFNLLKNKHTSNRLYGGLRYGFTFYKVDIHKDPTPDPVWGTPASFYINGESCNYHWAEIVFGLDTKIWGPLHMGWDIRYKRRLVHKDSSVGNAWYVPGFGKYGDTRIGANFNVIIDI